MTEKNNLQKNDEKVVKKDNSRKIKIGDTTYIISSNFTPTKENKAALLKVIRHLMKIARKPDL